MQVSKEKTQYQAGPKCGLCGMLTQIFICEECDEPHTVNKCPNCELVIQNGR